jgi:hypothetical protein
MAATDGYALDVLTFGQPGARVHANTIETFWK